MENGAKVGNFLLENGAIIPKIALENGADCAKIHVEGDIMLYRKVQKDINNWLNEGKKALLVTGARQVGKSYLIRETLKQNNCPYIEINFIENKKAKEMFDSFVKGDINNFLLTLKLLSEKELKKGSVIFLDEVQEVKEIVTIIKFLVEQGDYKYILSGSLLGVELNHIKSAPVGYLDIIDMYPLDLEEFFIANGLQEDIIEYLKNKFVNIEEVSENIHNVLTESFYRYLIVGGMPEAVQEYVTSQDLNKVYKIHMSIIRNYKNDFTKYEIESKSKLKLLKTYDLIPSELDSKNKRYLFTDLDSNLKFARYENSFNWLIDAGVSIPVYNVTEFQLPLEASKKSNLFKLFLSDVGLLTSLYGQATVIKLLTQKESINCGAIFENFVAQELKAHGFKTYYFNNKKHGEVDFLIEHDENLLPIEVKSGKDYQTHSALSYFMTTKYFSKAFVFSSFNVSKKDNIIYYPVYMIMFLNNIINMEKLDKIDLSKLSVK